MANDTDRIEPGVYNEEQAADYLGISKYSLRRMRTEPEKYGEGPKWVQLGLRRFGYRKVSLDAWLETREIDPGGSGSAAEASDGPEDQPEA